MPILLFQQSIIMPNILKQIIKINNYGIIEELQFSNDNVFTAFTKVVAKHFYVSKFKI